MGHTKAKTHRDRSHTLPSSPTHSSSSSSDFEFTISLSPRKSTSNICPADELFYNGQLLPLHLSPRLSMVRTLLLSSSSSSSSSATTASRLSSDSHSSSSTDSSARPSSVSDPDTNNLDHLPATTSFVHINTQHKKPPNKYFSLSRFSSVFRKESKPATRSESENNVAGSTVKRMGVTAKEVIRRYFKKTKPLYEKLSHKQGQSPKLGTTSMAMSVDKTTVEFSVKDNGVKEVNTHSFSGNLRYPRKRSSYVSSCPSSMRSSPSHSGILSRNAFVKGTSYADTSSMEELQSAIQGAIAHCKNSMTQNVKSEN